MNVQAFIENFRHTLNDEVAPYLWSDAEVITYLNDAINEACERALLIEDRTTPEVCNITLVPGQGDYFLHESVIKVKRVTYRGHVLEETSVEALDQQCHNWEARNGRPHQYICGQNFGFRVVPIPTLTDVPETLALTVYRLPLVEMVESADTDIPEVPVRFHMRLLPWMYRCAYLKQDSETLNEGQAAKHEATFIASFGERIGANVQRKQRDRRPQVVQFNW